MNSHFPKNSLAICPHRQKEKLVRLGLKGTKYEMRTYTWSFVIITKIKKEKRFCINILDPRCRGWISIDELIYPSDWDNRGLLD